MVGAQAIVGDIVSPRDRGRYQGLFGAVFGIASIIGPLLGGVFVEQLSWHWIFYINLPIGAVALTVIAIQVPGRLSRIHHIIDYLGTALLMASASCLVLFTSLGGTTYPWGAPLMIGFAVAGAVLLAVFVVVERRAAEPVLPLHLFSNRGFSSTSVVGFIVGLALFGAVTYLPVFFQIVHGESPTDSGLQLLPLLAGMIVCSTGSGYVISRTGRYRAFPITGTALITAGILLLAQVGVGTSLIVAALFMFVLGVGLGCVMQVLVLIVQNAVPYSELGVATSGATFFRSIGGSFGTAIFGAIFSNVLTGNLARHLGAAKLPSERVEVGHHPGDPGHACRRRSTTASPRPTPVDPDGVHDRRADRRDRIPRVLADTPGRAPPRSRRGARSAGGGAGRTRHHQRLANSRQWIWL